VHTQCSEAERGYWELEHKLSLVWGRSSAAAILKKVRVLVSEYPGKHRPPLGELCEVLARAVYRHALLKHDSAPRFADLRHARDRLRRALTQYERAYVNYAFIGAGTMPANGKGTTEAARVFPALSACERLRQEIGRDMDVLPDWALVVPEDRQRWGVRDRAFRRGNQTTSHIAASARTDLMALGVSREAADALLLAVRVTKEYGQ
jgi:hypothetical protein